jgi:hypothetical protein
MIYIINKRVYDNNKLEWNKEKKKTIIYFILEYINEFTRTYHIYDINNIDDLTRML